MWKRICPKCGEEISYKTKSVKNRAEKRNTNCLSCSKKGKNNPMFGKCNEDHHNYGKKWFLTDEQKKNFGISLKGRIFTEEHRKRLSKSKIGDKNPAKRSEVRKKISESVSGENHPNYGKKRSEETRKRIGESRKGKTYEELYGKEKDKEMRKKQRLSRLKHIEKNNGQVSPNYNPNAIPIIEEYGKKNGYNFQHAENGGEVCIDGYWPDGIDEKRKTIIEIDEPRHFNSDGTYKQKDIQRQIYLEGLGYKFIRVKI